MEQSDYYPNNISMSCIEEMSYSEFSKLEPVFCQRNEQLRKRTTSKLLKKRFLPTTLEVALARYPDGDLVILNGNTRQAIWKDGLLPKPPKIFATIYDVKNDDDAKALYNTFDSSAAVETTKHKLQGVFRTNNLSFDSPKIQKGSIVKPLQYASADNPDIQDPKNFFEVVPYFKDELLALDKFGCSKLDVTLICAILMLLKFHGTTNDRLNKGIRNLIKGYNEGKDEYGYDGVGFIIKEWEAGHYLGEKGTDGKSLPKQLDFVLWSFEKWMNRERIQKFKGPSDDVGKGKRSNVYETFWDYLRQGDNINNEDEDEDVKE